MMLFWLLPPDDREQIRQEMLELHAERRLKLGRARAGVWLAWHTARLVVSLWRHQLQPGGLMRGWWLDVRHVARGLRASRMFTVVAVVSLALGIGANASMFSVIRTLLLDDMAVKSPEELSLVYWHHPGDLKISQMNSSGGRDEATGVSLRSNVSYPLYRSMQAALDDRPGFEAFGFTFLRDVTVAIDGRPATLAGGLGADEGYFSVLAPRIALGRGIEASDDRDDAEPVVVLSHRLFMRMFGGDQTALGQVLRLNGIAARIIGVTAPEFRGLSKGGFFPQTEVTVPLRLVQQLQPSWAAESLVASERHFWMRVMVRAPASIDRAVVASRLAGAVDAHVTPMATGEQGPPLVSLQDGRRGLNQTSAETRRLLWILMGVVGVVLVVAWVNLAGLMLARGQARQRELGVRRALGAGRWRLVRAQLIEGVLLALAGSAGGLWLTYVSRAALTNILTAGLGTAPMSRQPLEVSVDAMLMGSTVGLSVLVAIVFSLLPAWRLTRSGTSIDVRHAVAGGASSRWSLGRSLVAIQVAMTIPLLVCAALFLRTVDNLSRIDLGFDPAGIAYFKVNPATLTEDANQQAAIYLRLIEQIRQVPGVTSATLIENALLSGIVSNTTITVGEADHSLYINSVGPDFLDTIGLRLLAGRMPGMQDTSGAPRVGVLNQLAARRMFGDVSPVGQVLQFSNGPVEIVGVVSDARYDRQRADVRPTLYPSALQRAGYGGHFVVIRTAGPVGAVESDLRRAVAVVSPDLPVPEIKTQDAQIREQSMRERVFAQMLSLFGGFVLLLACIGLHGVTAYSVARRTNEIGVRMALGASPSQVLGLVLRYVALLAGIGLAVGVPAALWIAPLFGSLLFGVQPTDVPVLVISAAVMCLVALAAGWLPARRAAQLDPLKALRSE
jgi:predicted permease